MQVTRILNLFGSLNPNKLPLYLGTVAFIGCAMCWSILAQDLTGEWKLNVEETSKLQPKIETVGKKGKFRATGTGSILLPPQRSMLTPSKTINPPIVLNCDRAKLEHNAQTVKLTCNEIDTRDFHIGKHHGRVAKWRKKQLTERYSSTSRNVEHRFRLLEENRMEVLVRIKPKGAKRLRHILIYDRVVE